MDDRCKRKEMIEMNEGFMQDLNLFLQGVTYVVTYRFNYDSAKDFNDELIKYIKTLQHQLEKQNSVIDEIKDTINATKLQDLAGGLYYCCEEYPFVKDILDKINELEEKESDK